MLVVGLTGGVATGKSIVANHLRQLGAPIVDADRLAREVVEPGEPALEQIKASFGPEVIDAQGRLDRKKLGQIVFQDAKARKTLEDILHPLIRERMHQELKRLEESGQKIAVCDIPLLYESRHSLKIVDKVVVVYAPKEAQKARLMERDGLTSEEADLRIAAQLPTEDKVAKADYVIDNSSGTASTLRQVERVWKELTDYASGLDRSRQEKK